MRGQIDELDNQLMELLAKRMRVCREIGTYKKEHNMTVLQTNRYNEILDKRAAQASLCGMSPEFAARYSSTSTRRVFVTVGNPEPEVIHTLRSLLIKRYENIDNGSRQDGKFLHRPAQLRPRGGVYEKDAKRLRFTTTVCASPSWRR